MERTTIIAEIGVNHNGDYKLAKQMVDVARECGADIVKFQTFNVDSITSKYAEMAQYQKENLGEEKSQKEMLRSLTLSHEEFTELAKYCNTIGILFLSTPFDIESIRFLDSIQNIWKIPSGEITNYPYLVEIAKTKKKVIISTGMSTLDEVDEAVNVLKNHGTKDIILLHCTTDYPAPIDSVNLNAMLTLKDRFNYPVGYSDHTRGIEVSIAAVAMGASVIEKHFTLDKTMPGPDHKASLEPCELKQLVTAIRNIERAKGTGEKHPTETEIKNQGVVRKSIVASKAIKKGDIFTEDNLTTKRPGNGISPMNWNKILGTTADRDYEEDELIKEAGENGK